MMSADGAEDLATMDILTLGDTDMNIFVGNLAFTTTEQELRQLFEPYGTVDTIRIMECVPPFTHGVAQSFAGLSR